MCTFIVVDINNMCILKKIDVFLHIGYCLCLLIEIASLWPQKAPKGQASFSFVLKEGLPVNIFASQGFSVHSSPRILLANE